MEWRKFYDLSNPQDFKLPEPYANVDQLIYLIILKCIRSDKIVPAIRVGIRFYSILYTILYSL